MNKKKLFVLPILSVLVLAGCGSNDEKSSSTPPASSSEPAPSSSVDPNANKRVTAAVFEQEVTNWGMFGLDRKVTVTSTSNSNGGDEEAQIATETVFKFDEGKVLAHRETKSADESIVYYEMDVAYLIEKNQEDNKIYYKERYVKEEDQWIKNTTVEEYSYTTLYDNGIYADKYLYSSFTFDETTGKYKCASVSANIHGNDYLIENIEIAFENNKVKSVSNKLSSQDAEQPGSYTTSIVFSNYGTTTVTLPEAEENTGPLNEELSEIFLNVGSETLYLAASKERPAKSNLYNEVTGASQRQNLLQTPGVLLYLVGKLYENKGFDCLDKLVRFRCAYDIQAGPGQTMVLDNKLDLMIHIDKEEGQILFYGYQDSLQTIGTDTTPVVSPIYIEIEYDFETDEMGDFKLWEITGTTTPSTTYCEYIDGVLKTLDYNHRNDDGDYAKESAVIEAAVALMTEKRATMTEADAATARLYGEGFVATQAYASEVFGYTIPMTIHED